MFLQPIHPQLRESIVCYWFIKTNDIPRHTKMLPDGHSDIMLNMGLSYTLSDLGGNAEEISGSVFFGQRTKCLLLDQPGKVDMVGIRLRPGKEFLFSGMPAETLLNRHFPLSDLLGDAIARVEQNLRDDTLLAENKIRVVEEMLLELLAKSGKKGNEKVDETIAAIVHHKGNIALQELLAETGITYKQAERQFKKHLGISPKMYLRIYRFYHAFTLMRGKEKADWIAILSDCGYYDQSHFIKDFNFFAGRSPAQQLSVKDSLDELFGFN